MNNVVITRYKNFIFSGLFSEFSIMDCDFAPNEDDAIRVGDVYVGYVENIVKGINSAFVRIKPGINGYYPLDVNTNHIFMCPKNNDKLSIGDKILVQVKSEALKTKPVTLTSAITIPGMYSVAVNDGNGIMISQKLHDREKIQLLKDGLQHVASENGIGIVVRTNAGTAPIDDVVKEAGLLSSKLKSVLDMAEYQTLYTKVLGGNTPYENFVNNLNVNEVDKIVTDIPEIYHKLQASAFNVELYTDSYPLEKLYSIDTQLQKLLQNRVWLDCGGYLIIEGTEALTVIDVNSGKYQGRLKDRDLEYYKINHEAAVEIARQLRLRNLSGIIIVDFINMSDDSQKQKIIDELNSLVKSDKVPTTIVDITKLGLVEITRKKVRKPLHELIAGK